MTKEFRSSKPEFCCERQKGARAFGALLIRVSFVIWHSSFVIAPCSTVLADDFAALCADRAAIEQVYYNHRIGTKAPFEETMPPALVEKLVREDLHKEMVLKKVYAVEITPALLESEVQRINTTTRAPDVLAELKAALGNDTNRFARTMAKPILVERVLRDKFDNDDALHAGVRRECELVRNALLAAKTNGANAAQLLAQLKGAHSNAVTETTWQLTTRPAGTNAAYADEFEIKKRFGPDAQIIGAPGSAEKDRKFYFDELPPELQNVLRVQLRKPGDISAVIETPSGFLLYVARESTEQTLSVAVLSLPKRSYEEWVQSVP